MNLIWAVLGPSWAPVGQSWGRVGALLGPSWPSGGGGVSSGRREAVLGRPGVISCRFGSPQKPFWANSRFSPLARFDVQGGAAADLAETWPIR